MIQLQLQLVLTLLYIMRGLDKGRPKVICNNNDDKIREIME